MIPSKKFLFADVNSDIFKVRVKKPKRKTIAEITGTQVISLFNNNVRTAENSYYCCKKLTKVNEKADDTVQTDKSAYVEPPVTPQHSKDKTAQSANLHVQTVLQERLTTRKKRPCYKKISKEILEQMFKVGTAAGNVSLGKQQNLWIKVCVGIYEERQGKKLALHEHGIDFSTLNSKWASIKFFFYKNLIKNAYQEFFTVGSTMKVDGLLFISSSLRHVQSELGTWVIPFPNVKIDEGKKSRLKGSRIVSNADKIWIANFGYRSGLKIEVLLLQKSGQFDMGHAYRKLCEGVDLTLMEMWTSQTAQRMRQIPWGSSFGYKSPIWVYSGELIEFSSMLHAKLQFLLPEYSPCFLTSSFGQSCEIIQFSNAVAQTDMSDTYECIVHVAEDIECPTGKIMLWKKKEVEELVGLKCDLNYYVGGIPGLGNFTFFDTRGSKLPTSVEGIKLYSSFAKFIHTQKNPPFSTPQVSAKMIKFINGSHKRRKEYWLKFKENSKLIRQFINSIEYSVFYLRCELIVRVDILSNQYFPIEKLSLFTRETFDNLSLTKCYQSYSLSSFKEMLLQNINPALKTIDFCVNQMEQSSYKWEFPTFSRDDILNVMCAELVICFLLRGFSLSTFREKRHDVDLCRIIGLDNRNFKDVGAFTPYLFNRSFEELPISLDGEGFLVFSGPRTFAPWSLRKLEIMPDKTYEFMQNCFEVCTQNSLIQIARAICKYVSTGFRIAKRGRPSTYFLRNKDVQFIHGHQAIHYSKESCHAQLRWIICECERLIDKANIPRWEFILQNELELFSINRNVLLTIPGSDDGTFYVIVPLVSLAPSSIGKSINFVISHYAKIKKMKISTTILEIVYSRILQNLTVEQRKQIPVDLLLKVICRRNIDIVGAKNYSDEFSVIFAEPFPQQ